MNTKEMIAAIEDLRAKTKELEETISGLKRDRGPKSTKEMSDDDARRVKFGDLKNESHRKAAEILGLSYGQVYSAREGYTFKHIKETATAA